MQADGTLTLAFNKPIKQPDIIIGDPDQVSESTRLLNKLWSLDEVIKISVKDADEDDTFDKQICGSKLTKFDPLMLTIEVSFCNPKDITSDILEPDVMEITIALPQLFIDAETNKSIQTDESSVSPLIELVPQMSKTAYKELIEKAETAANVGTAFSFWQILLLFAAGKALKSMWVLFYVLQFLVYMSTW